ncbi:MAG: cyclic pyranopterin monophosphate synthase MoaC, partial [Candidatus Bathyarchaeia archaeon]
MTSLKQKDIQERKTELSQEQNATGEVTLVMVDVSDKAEIFREATASGTIKLKPETIGLIKTGK